MLTRLRAVIALAWLLMAVPVALCAETINNEARASERGDNSALLRPIATSESSKHASPTDLEAHRGTDERSAAAGAGLEVEKSTTRGSFKAIRAQQVSALLPDAPTDEPGEPNWLEPKMPAKAEPVPRPAALPVSITPPPAETYVEEPGIMGHGGGPFHRLFDRLDELGCFGPPPQGRYRPWGTPLHHTTWLHRRYSFAFLAGELFPGNPVGGRIEGQPGYVATFRFGWDFEHYWGLELRVGTSSFGLRDSTTLVPPSDLKMFQADMNLMYYPWGDTRWRPYATLGLGVANIAYNYGDGSGVNATAGALPFGFGLKYRHNERWVLRAEVLDYYTFQSSRGADAMSNLMVSAGVEYRIGWGVRRTYWPWNPSHVPF
jgi:hypothetical protein